MPLPFVVNRDPTFTIYDDSDVQVKGSCKGDLRKRQFTTMHVFCNAGTGKDRGGYKVLVEMRKLMKGNCFTAVEKAVWSTNIPFLFQKMHGWTRQ